MSGMLAKDEIGGASGPRGAGDEPRPPRPARGRGQASARIDRAFGRLFAFRNRMVQLCDRVGDEVVYALLANDLADLEELARLYLAHLPA